MRYGLSIVAVCALAGAAWALDVADMTIEWTPEGKQLAAERAKLPAMDEMVPIPAGLRSWTISAGDTPTAQRRSVRWSGPRWPVMTWPSRFGLRSSAAKTA